MIIVPFQTPDHVHDTLVIVLGEDNVGRMREADPVEINLRNTGKHLVNPTVIVCYEEDHEALLKILREGGPAAAFKYLGRGFRFRPEMGDPE